MTEATLIHQHTRRMMEAALDGTPLPLPFDLKCASNPTSSTIISPALTSRFHL